MQEFKPGRHIAWVSAAAYLSILLAESVSLYTHPAEFKTISLNVLHYYPILLFRVSMLLFVSIHLLYLLLAYPLYGCKTAATLALLLALLMVTVASLNSRQSESKPVQDIHNPAAIAYLLVYPALQACLAWKRGRARIALAAGAVQVTMTLFSLAGVHFKSSRKLLILSVYEHIVILVTLVLSTLRLQDDGLRVTLVQRYARVGDGEPV